MKKQYSPSDFEDDIYSFWMKRNYFHPTPDQNKKPYTIVMPPPNITGQLHMGHALDETLQDILIRFYRMKGYAALWLPGTDHAAIATEAKIVAALKEEGITKKDLGREEFLRRSWEWKNKYGNIITGQLKKLGSSCDWQRERFTMDEGCSKAVNDVFIKLYEEGLIYRGERMINWCPRCLTSISDAEVDFTEHSGHFYYILYPLSDGGGHIKIATTRPETLLGDTAVAVHPDDERYKDLIGKTLILPIVNRKIPVISDEYVEREFGTGAVKITPAHDPNDFEVGLRHNLPIVNVMDEKAVMNENAGAYAGLTRTECRIKIVEDLKTAGLLEKTEPMTHNVGECYRCQSVVEPRISEQWFVKMKPLAEPAIECVNTGKTKFVPSHFEKIYFNWMENIKDWCISRQLWWGHRIPAWYCSDCGHITVTADTPAACQKCGHTDLHQDEDTLDTWFSSALWPFSTLGWPENTEDLEFFYPTNTLVTGYDIIFFWVARMIFSACAHTGKAPFDTVFIHGIVRDAEGRKMSKSLGNGIDPLEIINKYGADSLRFFLVTGNSPGNDLRFIEQKIEAGSNFANKLWNAARFVHMNIDGRAVENVLPNYLDLADKWILSGLNTVAKESAANIEKFELGLALSKIYDFIWDCYCDWYIELVKPRLQADSPDSQNARQVLVYVLDKLLRLLHPFMPFITEKIWQFLPRDGETIMLAGYPLYIKENVYLKETAEMESIMSAIRAVRALRQEMNVPPSKKSKLYIETDLTDTFNKGISYISKLAYASDIEISGCFDLSNTTAAVTSDAKLHLPMSELIDRESELTRLQKELAATEKLLAQSEGKLNNPGFIAKAPPKVIETVQGQAQKEREKINKIKDAIEAL